MSVVPLNTTFELAGKTMSRSQTLVVLLGQQSVAVQQSQGLTLTKANIGLGSKEFANVLTFVGLSCVKSLVGLLIVGVLDYGDELIDLAVDIPNVALTI